MQRAGKKFKRKKPKDQGEGYAARPSSEMGQSEGWNLLRVDSSDRNVQARKREWKFVNNVRDGVYGCPWWGEEQSCLAGLTGLLSGRGGWGLMERVFFHKKERRL